MFQILRIYILQQVLFHILLFQFIYIKTNGIGINPACDNPIDTIKSTATNEKNILGVDLNQLLFRVLSSSLWWNQYFCSFQQFQQSLLYTFTTYITGNRRIIAFARNLINFINIYNSSFGSS